MSEILHGQHDCVVHGNKGTNQQWGQVKHTNTHAHVGPATS